MSDLVELESVDLTFASRRAVLRGVQWSFGEAMTHAVTGRSGCGKSTLLYIAGLMLRPTNGEVRICGTPYGGASDRRRALARASLIGFVFQDALLEPSMSVWENVVEGVPMHDSPRSYERAASEHLERLSLGHLRDSRASQLSGGQAQRVALIRAMLKNPRVLLADEPTGNLDDATAQVVLDELFAFGGRPGHTTVIVTHDRRIAHRADTCLELEQANA